MKTFMFYQHLTDYISNGVFHATLSSRERDDMRRASSCFVIKDGRLFYIGPKKQYMRMVVLSEEEKRSALQECHNNPGTGNHNGVRGTRDRVIAGYLWSGLKKDVTEWVRCCHHCQLNDPMKTQAPVLHSIKVDTAWEVVGLDLIGPLRVTGRGNQYVMTMTDLFTKWVTAETLTSKNATEVTAAIVGKMYTFGMVRKIITDQGKEFVNELNEKIFEILKIKHSVSSAYHPQTNGQDERTNQNIKRALRKYVNDNHDDWDLHLPAVVYGINTALQASTRHTPYFLMFNRHPHLPEVMNACPMGDTFEVGDPDEGIDTRVAKMKVLNDKVLGNIEMAQARQKKSFESRKRKSVRVCSITVGDDVLISDIPSKRGRKEALESHHKGPFTVASITTKGVATVVKDKGQRQQLNVSRLRPYYRSENHRPSKVALHHDHRYMTSGQDHLYACPGDRWEKGLGPLQDKLLKYVLDTSRPGGELIVRDGDVCLIREEFWSLGLSRCMDSNIGNACLRIVWESAQRHGKDVHIVDMFEVPTWKTTNVDPLVGLPDFPRQTTGEHCGVLMLMYAHCICTGAPFHFLESDVPSIRKWWCVQLMETFSIEGHGQRFAFWTEEAKALLAGSLAPLFRLPRRSTPSNPLKEEPKIIKDLHLAVQWVCSNQGLFTGEVKQPTFLKMTEEDQQEALRVALEEEDPGAKDSFVFVFDKMEDMEVFLRVCWDKQGLHVNSMCTNSHTP